MLIKDILVIISGMGVLSPCLLMLNVSDTILPNVLGFIYCIFLCLLGSRKSIKRKLIRFFRAMRNIERRLDL
jgi:hypothetical protein